MAQRRSACYISWAKMKQRCNNPNHESFPYYGGRGISYDPAWETFDNFYNDMGRCPSGLTLERSDNDKDYSKDNCRWATRQEQAANKRLYKTSMTGVAGVNLFGEKYTALGYNNGRQRVLYSGKDFFEACCRRKSWEVAKSRGGVLA